MRLAQIRDVDVAVHDALKARAADRGQSLNAFLRELLAREAMTPPRGEVLRRIARRSQTVPPSTVDIIREARDSRSTK